MKISLINLFLVFSPLIVNCQVLEEINANNEHREIAELYKQNKIKRTFYTITSPSLVSMEFPSDKNEKPKSVWQKDTITFSKTYSKNGFIESEKDILPNDQLYYLKEFYFDSLGNLKSTKEVNNKKIRFYDYQEMAYYYLNNQLSRIDKIRSKKIDTTTDTTRTTTLFYYSEGKLEKAIERDNNNGDTLLSSYFTYYIKENYIEEKSFLKEWCIVTCTYYYVLDNKMKIAEFIIGQDDKRKDTETFIKLTDDNTHKVAPYDGSFNHVEKYD